MQFRTLVAHFFDRLFDKDSMSADADPAGGVIQLLALLTVPGLMISFFLLPLHPPGSTLMAGAASAEDRMWLSTGDRYLFVSYAMMVMGLLMTFKWDMLFPDRRDYLILTALPISARRWFIAKVVALAAFLLLFVVAINFFSLLMSPAFIGRQATASYPSMRAILAHAGGTLGGSLFAALFFGAVQGVMINVLSPETFRRISARIQMLSIAVLVTLLLLTPLIKASIPPLIKSNSALLHYFPPMWFLGVYESLAPVDTLVHASGAWARTALTATLIVAFVFAISYFIGYRRYSRKILESVETDSLTTRWLQTVIAGILNRTVLRNPIQRAAFHFIGKVSDRSGKHRLLAALFTGVGIALAVSSLFVFDSRDAFPVHFSMRGLLQAPLILSFVAVAGLRATFKVPHELNANWIFQTGAGGGAEYVRAVRKWILLCRVVPLYAVLAPFEFILFDVRTATFHLTFDLVVTAFLTEAFFFSFNKVPFTCALLSRKLQLGLAAVGYLYGFMWYIAITTGIKRSIVTDPERMATFLAASAALFAVVSIYRRYTRDRRLRIVYDETDTAIQQLNLT
jgi:hypothetical protein